MTFPKWQKLICIELAVLEGLVIWVSCLFQFLFHEIFEKISWNWINVFLKYCDPKSHLTALNKMAVWVLYWYRRKNWINFRGWLRIHVFTEITVEASLETIHLKWGIFKKYSHLKKKFAKNKRPKCGFDKFFGKCSSCKETKYF